MQIFVHVGLHKTGTSAVQKYLNENRVDLLDHGVYYPETGGLDAHHDLSSLLRIKGGEALTKNRAQIFTEKFQRFVEAAAGKKLLLSSEIFSEEVDLSVFSGLSNKSTNLKVVIYLRRQDLLLESAFNQMLKQSGSYNKDILNPPVYSVDFYALIKRWENMVGEGNVIVRRYQKSSMVGGDVVKDFLTAIGLDPSVFPDSNRSVVNESLSLVETKILNSLAKYQFEDWSKICEYTKAFVDKYYSRDDARMVGNYLKIGERKAFYEGLRESNLNVLHQYFNDETELFNQEFNENKAAVSVDPMDVLVDFFNTKI